MRARAKRAALALPGPKSKARFAALAPPHPPSGHLLPQAGEGLPPHLSPRRSGSTLLLRSGRRASSSANGSNVPISPSYAEWEKGFSIRSLPLRPEPALLLRSGRRWRVAPDEGASEASCSCSFQNHPKQSQEQRFAALAPPHPPSGHLLP